MTDDYILTLEDIPAAGDLNTVRAGLAAYYDTRADARPQGELAVFLRDANGTITGGVYGEIRWGWLYVDVVWVTDEWRGLGNGRRLMAALEQGAAARGVSRVYLATTDFQALPFYQKIGYELWAGLDDRPPGYRYHYLKKQDIERRSSGNSLPVEEKPRIGDIAIIVGGLKHHARIQGAALVSQQVVVFLREIHTGQIRGGLIGSTYWGWLDLMHFWLDDDLRDQVYGEQLLTLAEDECRVRGVSRIVTDTVDDGTRRLLERAGYTVFGTLEIDTPSSLWYFLKKEGL